DNDRAGSKNCATIAMAPQPVSGLAIGELVLRNLTQNQKWIVATVYVCGMILNSLDSTIVNVTLATLGREFGVEASEIEAVSVAYLVSLAVIMPASGWLSDRFGPKRVFLTALGIYA